MERIRGQRKPIIRDPQEISRNSALLYPLGQYLGCTRVALYSWALYPHGHIRGAPNPQGTASTLRRIRRFTPSNHKPNARRCRSACVKLGISGVGRETRRPEPRGVRAETARCQTRTVRRGQGANASSCLGCLAALLPSRHYKYILPGRSGCSPEPKPLPPPWEHTAWES